MNRKFAFVFLLIFVFGTNNLLAQIMPAGQYVFDFEIHISLD